jgi:hypothetical protein
MAHCMCMSLAHMTRLVVLCLTRLQVITLQTRDTGTYLRLE